MEVRKEVAAQVISKFSAMRSTEDLLAIINFVKPIIYGEKAVPFSQRQINYYSISHFKIYQYRKSFILKKSGGKREINAPVKGLKHLQTCLNFILQLIFSPHDAVSGFVPGRSIVDNAKRHVCKGFVYNIDIKDFFPSIDQARIWACLQLHPFNLGNSPQKKQLANRIASICCAPLEFLLENGDKKIKSVLPQGAPTSPVITNIVAQKLDRRLQGVANRFHISYSRYADDITFSSNQDIFQENGDIVKEIRRVVVGQNFTVNESKVRLQKRGFRQEVTGLIVNEKINVPRRYVYKLRQWLYMWESYGHDKAYRFFLNDYLKDKGHVKSHLPSMTCVIGGKLDYLKMVKGNEDSVYLKLNNRYLKLTEKNKDPILIINDRLESGLNSNTAVDDKTQNQYNVAKDINVVLEKIISEGLESAMNYYLN